jgi:tetratricopeptide (TPR) repeat protein
MYPPVFVQAMDVSEQVLGKEHSCTMTCAYNMAKLLQQQAQYKQSEAIFRELLDTSDGILKDPKHPEILKISTGMADVFLDMGKVAAAESICWRSSREDCETVLGPGHPFTINSIAVQAKLLYAQGLFQEAEALRLMAVQNSIKYHSLQNPLAVACLNGLASMLLSEEKTDEAESVITQAEQGCQAAAYEFSHPLVLRGTFNKAKLLRAKGNLEAAESMIRKLLETQSKQYGAVHPETMTTQMLLSGVLHDQAIALSDVQDEAEKLEEARVLCQQVIEGFIKALGANHPQTVESVKLMQEINYDVERIKPPDLTIQFEALNKLQMGDSDKSSAEAVAVT